VPLITAVLEPEHFTARELAARLGFHLTAPAAQLVKATQHMLDDLVGAGVLGTEPPPGEQTEDETIP